MLNKSVNVFHKYTYYVTALLSECCKTYCFAFQRRLFCVPIVMLLPMSYCADEKALNSD